MKIIHCSDLHLDSKFDYLDSQKAIERRGDILRSFERLCDYADKNGICAVIISGDLFDSNKFLKRTVERLAYIFNKYSKIFFLYVYGNHDSDADFVKVGDFPSNFICFGNEFSSYRFDNVVIGGISLNSVNCRSFYEKINFSKNDYNILALHGESVNYKNNSKDSVISLPDLQNKNIDYLALGHYHSYSCEKLNERGVCVYSGCLEGRGFDETGDKGFVLIDTDNIDNKFSFVDFCFKKYYELTYSVKDYERWLDLRNKILKDVSIYKSNSLLKIVLTGERSADFFIDKSELTSHLISDFYYVKVEDKTIVEISKKDYENDKSVKGEFIRLVLESDLDIQQKNKIIACGLNALNGEDYI